MTVHRFELVDRDPCDKCKGACVVTLDVGRSGYSCGTDYNHADDCPTQFCAHGIRWGSWKNWGDCAACVAEDEQRVAEIRAEEELEEGLPARD